jgi:SpoVK/Ycf46/Vps4 family AAA+-type ATPase
MIGLDSVKKSVKSLFDMTISNYKRELEELEPDAVSLNRVFLGSPGTGKTTVAKFYGQILAELGLISNGEGAPFRSLNIQVLISIQVVVKNPADLIGNVIGQSEANTKAILAATLGKVLVIDEVWPHYTFPMGISGLHALLRFRQRGEHGVLQDCCDRYSCCRGSERSGRW